MKKLFFAFMTIALISSASSCKKCGYCQDANGSHSSAVCQNNNALTSAIAGNEYKQAEADCKAQPGSSWIVE